VTATRSLRVELGERSYPIVLGHGILGQLGEAVKRHTGASRAAVVTVPPVGRRYGGVVSRSLREAGLRVMRFEVPDGDASKSLRQAERLWDGLLEKGADRGVAVVALGGGMVGDLAGFVAATYLRGVPFVQVPTTLLAVVDSSVGGKVAVNRKQGKNLVGAFHQPRLVWADVATLGSLPRRQRAAGLAEVVKAAVIRDAALFERLEGLGETLLDVDPAVLLPILERACAIKAEVVAQDERESGVRMLLNFGHSMAHAVEKLQRYRGLVHGEAVAVGMVFAARRSEELGLAPAGIAERLRDLLERLELPVAVPEFPRRAYLEALGVDKKKRDGQVRFVVLRELGRAEIHSLTPAAILPAGRTRAGRGPGR
jgi:3-dehydroquinate synthase